MLIPDIFINCPYSLPTKGILHIGAFDCEEKPFYLENGIKNENILWIEALEKLVERNSLNNNILNAVISDKDDEEIEFTITNNLSSSSILNLKEHLNEHPDIFVINKLLLKTITLNSFYDKHNINYDKYDFINIDIQGAELKALKGATKILPHIKAIYTEVNIKEIYENCCLIEDLDNYLKEFNFIRILTKFTPNGWGDALYIKMI